MKLAHTLDRFAAATAIAGVAALIVAFGAYAAGARINTTKSFPLGLYWTSDEPVVKGSYVFFCPPEQQAFAMAKARHYIGAGLCPGGYGYMLKRVLAAEGDEVVVTDDGVTVNGRKLPLSTPIQQDGAGRPLPVYRSTAVRLGADDVLLMSDVHAGSFDARYFGPLSRRQIQTAVKPVFTW